MRRKYEPGDIVNGFKMLDRWRNSTGLFVCLYCGKEFKAWISNIVQGKRKSCGCKWNKKHGYSGTKIHHKWTNMRGRCNNELHDSYRRYSKLGYDPAWDNFMVWLEYMKSIPSWPGITAIENGGWEIHRVDNEKGYFPGNIEWVTTEKHREIHRK